MSSEQENIVSGNIQDMVEFYLKGIDGVSPGLLQGFYIVGSLALGEFMPGRSDLDFVAVTSERLSSKDQASIQQVHRKVENLYASPGMSGIYVTWDDLGKLPHEVEPFPYYDEGRLHEAGYFEMNLVTWYELKEMALCFRGPEPSELAYEVEWDHLLVRMYTNLNTYWKKWLSRAQDPLSGLFWILYFRRVEIEWGVLGISRLYYTFHEHAITSKAKAGEYAIGVVPEQWHRIVKDCIRARQGKSTLYSSSFRRRGDAIRYMRYIMDECQKIGYRNVALKDKQID